MSVNTAIDFLKNDQKAIVNKIKHNHQDVGLGYIKLGQSSNTLYWWRSSKNQNCLIFIKDEIILIKFFVLNNLNAINFKHKNYYNHLIHYYQKVIQ